MSPELTTHFDERELYLYTFYYKAYTSGPALRVTISSDDTQSIIILHKKCPEEVYRILSHRIEARQSTHNDPINHTNSKCHLPQSLAK